MDAHDQPQPVKLVPLDLRQEITGIDKVHGVYIAPLLGGITGSQR